MMKHQSRVDMSQGWWAWLDVTDVTILFYRHVLYVIVEWMEWGFLPLHSSTDQRAKFLREPLSDTNISKHTLMTAWVAVKVGFFPSCWLIRTKCQTNWLSISIHLNIYLLIQYLSILFNILISIIIYLCLYLSISIYVTLYLPLSFASKRQQRMDTTAQGPVSWRNAERIRSSNIQTVSNNIHRLFPRHS